MYEREVKAIYRKVQHYLKEALLDDTSITGSAGAAALVTGTAITSIISDVTAPRDLLVTGEMGTWEALTLT